MSRVSRNPRRGVAVAAVGLALALVIAACGGGGGSSTGATNAEAETGSGSATEGSAASNGVGYAESQVAPAKEVPQFTLEAPAFDMSGIEGKTIFNIPLTSAVPYVTETDEQTAKIAEEFGANWTEYTNNGTPNEWTAGINQAIAQHADVIVLAQSYPLSLILPALEKAKAAGIPVINTHGFENGQLDAEPPAGPGAEAKDLVTAYVTAPFWESTKLLANYAIEQSKGTANALLFTSSEVAPAEGMVAAFEGEFKAHCPECKMKVIDVPVAEWSKKLAPLTQSALAQDPNIDYVIPLFDSMSLYVIQGLTAAGKSNEIPVYSYNGTVPVLKLIQEGGPMKMDVGESINWLAHADMDQIGRVLTGAPLVKDGNEETPLRIFDGENIDEVGSPPAPDKGYGDAYVSGYEKLWSGKE